MGYPVQHNSTARPLLFFLASSWDHRSGVEGATPTVVLSKAGGAFSPPNGLVEEVGRGWYGVAVTATDTNTLGPLVLVATATNADECREVYDVVSYDPDTTATQTGDSFSRLGAAGTALTQLPWNPAWTATVRSIADAALTDYDPPTAAEMFARTIPSEQYATSAIVMAIYQDTRTLVLDPRWGRGVVPVDHNFGGQDALAYKTADGRGVDNAFVQAFLRADYEAGRRDFRYVQGTTTTNVLGRWVAPLMLDPGEYTLVFFKQGSYKPTTVDITVAEP